ncbi:MAG: hypothetical protein OSB65_08965 [Roseibacillus sp.]|nr:hypothetical protein [Roseibacillus sp.]
MPDEVPSPAEADEWLHKARKEHGATGPPPFKASGWEHAPAFTIHCIESTTETRMTYERPLL